MNIETQRQVKIFCRENDWGKSYSTGISQKQEDGTYLNAYLPVQFKKGTEPNGEANIYIKSAWLKPTKDMKVRIFINEYELVSEVAHRELNNSQLVAEAMQTEVEEDLFKNFDEVDLDNDLPF